MKNFFLKNSFAIILVLTCLIALPFGVSSLVKVKANDESAAQSSAWDENTQASASPVPEETSPPPPTNTPDSQPDSAQDSVNFQKPAEHPVDNDGNPCGTEESPSGAAAENSDDDEDSADPSAATSCTYAFADVPKAYFDDALFIGDSRTVGLYEYGDLDNADFFANSGMSVYNVFTEKVKVEGVGETDLAGLLENNSYEKIYIMLGINELGYNFTRTVEKYTEVIAQIQEREPGTIIFIEANLHVTAERSSEDALYNNANIDRFNSDIAKLADGESVFYLDVNPVFDDGEGNLNQEFSGDDTHLYGKYYQSWSDWFLTMGIVIPEIQPCPRLLMALRVISTVFIAIAPFFGYTVINQYFCASSQQF